jgi:hypothetical protein
MDEYNILLDVIKDVEKINDLEEFKNIPDVYTEEMKKKFVKIIKCFLNLFHSYEIKYQIICSALMFNWMLNNHFKSKLIANEDPKLKKVTEKKINELGSDFRIINCKYWKGKDVYEKYLL